MRTEHASRISVPTLLAAAGCLFSLAAGSGATVRDLGRCRGRHLVGRHA